MSSKVYLGALLAFSSFLGSVPSGWTVTAAAVCTLDITATFTGALSWTSSANTISLSSSGSTCAGSLLIDTGGISGGPSDSADMSCGAIVAGGSGSITYDGMASASMAWTYVGNVSAGVIVILLSGATIAGTALAVDLDTPTKLVTCRLGTTVSSVTFTAVMAFARAA